MTTPIILAELQARVWPRYLYGTPGNIQVLAAQRASINAAKTYRVTGKVRRTADANGILYVGVALFDAAGAKTPVGGAFWSYTAAPGVTPGLGWTTYTATFGAGTGEPFPGDAVRMVPLVLLNYGGTLGEMHCSELWIEDVAAPGVVLSGERNVYSLAPWQGDNTGAGLRLSTDVAGGDAGAYTRTFRFATAGYMTGPSDSPARTHYDGRVLQPGVMRAELPADFTGAITASYGEIVLANGDGALGDFPYHGLDGQQFTLKLGQADLALSAFTTVMVATMEQAVVDRASIRIRLRGLDARLQRPLLTGRYLGNNVLPNGLEGGAELAGQVKPRVYGAVENISPPCVNTTRLIYQVSDSFRGCAVTNVYVAGVALTGGAVYSSQADMETNAPAAGQFRAWHAGGMFRLGSTPNGLVTCDASGIPAGLGNPWELANVLWQMAYDAGVQTTEMAQPQTWVPPAPDNWNADWSTTEPNVGIWIDDLRTASEAMSEVAASLGAWFGFTRTTVNNLAGVPKFAVGIYPPSLSTMGGYTLRRYWFDESHILGVQAVAAPGSGRGVPTWRVDLSFRKNYTVFQPSMAPSLPPQGLGFLDLENLRTSTEDAAVLNKHPTAQTLVRETRIVNDRTGANLEAQRQLALRRAPKLWFDVRISLQALLTSNRFPLPVLGGLTYLKWPELRVLWQDGQTRSEGFFTINALEFDWARNEMRMLVRQATEQGF